MKILNLYSGIGGNRKRWNHGQVTAVEKNDEIAKVYNDHFPGDRIIVGDAHEYLLDNYNNYDFIWSSPPCQTHSRARFWASKGGKCKPKYAEMNLWQEIIFLKSYCSKRLWVVENVIPYYTALMKPCYIIGRHFIWSNFPINSINACNIISPLKITSKTVLYDFNLSSYKMNIRKDQLLRNCVNPYLGEHIINCALNYIHENNNNRTSR